MSPRIRSLCSLIAAGFFGSFLTLALGANNPKTPAVPKYSFQFAGPFLHVVDNDTNKMYIYLNEAKSSKLLGVVDLNETGKPEIKAVKHEDEKREEPK